MVDIFYKYFFQYALSDTNTDSTLLHGYNDDDANFIILNHGTLCKLFELLFIAKLMCDIRHFLLWKHIYNLFLDLIDNL